ncbi:MAG: hypothetical protein IT158_17795 [Bryobacterales bacterium]|nr:hypothetical protein [Bryobacterales bacterium]
MTRVQIRFRLETPLTESQLASLAATHKVYGILMAKPDPSLDALVVEYDATRLAPKEVEAVMRRAGIPVGVKA